MSLRLGFVGVGKWASKLRDSFASLGAKPTAYSRCGSLGAPEFGQRVKSWKDLLVPGIDALVICGPPEVTTEVGLACADAGKPCMATKPLMLEEVPLISAPFYVDFWRLWSHTWQRLSHYAEEDSRPRTLSVSMLGTGPYRSFPGLLDYGPHAAVFIRSITRDGISVKSALLHNEDAIGGEVISATYTDGHSMLVGNGWQGKPSRGAILDTGFSGTLQWDEDPENTTLWGPNEAGTIIKLESEPKALAIQRMCAAFLAAIGKGSANTAYLELSCAAMRDLRAIGELARKGGES